MIIFQWDTTYIIPKIEMQHSTLSSPIASSGRCRPSKLEETELPGATQSQKHWQK